MKAGLKSKDLSIVQNSQMMRSPNERKLIVEIRFHPYIEELAEVHEETSR